MKKAAFFMIAAAFILGAASTGFTATDMVVRIPYVVNAGGWSTGLAITHLSSTQITGLTGNVKNFVSVIRERVLLFYF